MGAFIVNFNVRTEDRPAVEAAVRTLHSDGAWVTGARNGWITVYESRASTQDDERIREVSERLSGAAHAPAIAFLVHDSDILAYWLYADGRPVDEYNSCPDYFGGGEEPAGPAGGDPDLLLPYCVPGTQREQVRQVLEEGAEVFAENHLLKLAALLGIDPDRVIADFQSIGTEADPAEMDATFVGSAKPAGRKSRRRLSVFRPDEDDDGPAAEEPPPDLVDGFVPAVAELLENLGLSMDPAKVDPRVQRLVHAAWDNNVAEIEQLIGAGVNVNGSAPGKRTTDSQAFAARMLTAGPKPVPMTPLLAAVGQRHHEATRRLLAAGADPNASHPLLGTPTHAVAITGDVDLLRLVLDAGGRVDSRDRSQQTPLQALQAFRQMAGPLRRAHAAQGTPPFTLPADEALAACEQLLRERTP